MRNKRLVFVLCGAVVFGLVAAVSVSRYLSSAQAYTKDLNSVVVAKVGIQPGEKIIAEQLEVVQFPRTAVPDGVFESADKLVGRVAVVNVAAREPITDFKLAPEGSAGGLSAMIPEGYRAMTVKVDDVVGVSGFVMPGALVDVVVVINPVDTGGPQNPISKIVLQNIKVLASGPKIDQPKNEREPTAVTAVTLQVTPEQAEKLVLASNEGKLQLVMRNYGDQEDSNTPGANKNSLMSGETMAAPPPPTAEQPKPSAPRPAARPRERYYIPREERPAAPVAVATPAPPPPRRTVEMLEGAKKTKVELINP